MRLVLSNVMFLDISAASRQCRYIIINRLCRPYIRNFYVEATSVTGKSLLDDDDVSFVNWLKEKGLKKKEYYLAVGRFVPENNLCIFRLK